MLRNMKTVLVVFAVEYIFKVGTSCGFTNAYNIDTIKEMIEPKTDTYLKNPLYNLVNNSVNSIDVDKLDYLQRDPRHIGLDYAFDPWRILNKSYIKENNVIYSKSLVSNILEMFRTHLDFIRIFIIIKQLNLSK